MPSEGCLEVVSFVCVAVCAMIAPVPADTAGCSLSSGPSCSLRWASLYWETLQPQWGYSDPKVGFLLLSEWCRHSLQHVFDTHLDALKSLALAKNSAKDCTVSLPPWSYSNTFSHIHSKCSEHLNIILMCLIYSPILSCLWLQVSRGAWMGEQATTCISSGEGGIHSLPPQK